MVLSNILLVFSSFVFGIVFGVILHKLFMDYLHKKETRKIKDANNNIFLKVYKDIRENRTLYSNRLGDIVSIKGSLIDIGEIEIIYRLDKNDISIFSKNSCIYTSDGIDKKIIDDIINQINIKYRRNIEDIVIVMGIIYYKPEFEKKFNISVDEMKNRSQKIDEMKLKLDEIKKIDEDSDIDKIIKNNKKKFDIDTILDKISSNGISNLSDDEKTFLKKYNE